MVRPTASSVNVDELLDDPRKLDGFVMTERALKSWSHECGQRVESVSGLKHRWKAGIDVDNPAAPLDEALGGVHRHSGQQALVKRPSGLRVIHKGMLFRRAPQVKSSPPFVLEEPSEVRS